jgi:trigger factor
LNIEKQYQDDHSTKLIVEVNPDQMVAYKKKAATRISSQAKIPGFRPGKAPYDVVLRTYGEAAITETAVDIFIDKEYSNILKEADVNPGASGTLEKIESMDPPKFIFRVPLAPTVDLGDYHSLRLDYKWEKPEQKDVDAALEDLRQMYASTENVEREIGNGDYVLLDVKSETEELNRTGFATFIREEGRPTEWPYEGFSKNLVGLKVGENKTIKHKFPKDWEIEELQDKDVEMEAAIKTVRGVILPDVNDEFAKMTGAGETVADLMEAVRKDVEARSQAQYDDVYFVDLIEKLKEDATIKYHEHTLEHEAEHVLSDLTNRLAQQGMDLETYFKMRNTSQEEFVKTEVEPVAKKRLERSLILDEIVKVEKIELDNDTLQAEYINAINSLAMQGVDLGKGGKKRQNEMSQAIAMDAASRVMTRKALDMLKSIATGNYKSIEEREAEAKKEEVKEESAEVVEEEKASE